MAAARCLYCSDFLQREFLTCFLKNPHYGSLINADGHAEVWTDWNDMSKFFQYGWRCTTNENAYSNHTLMGNWNQERYDLKNIMQPKPLPSQFGHYFETTYDISYNSKMPLSNHSDVSVKILLCMMSEILLPTFSSRIFMGSWLTFKSFIHFEFILLYGDLSESLTGSQDINLSWILLDINAQKSQLIQVAIQNLKLDITLSVYNHNNCPFQGIRF
ncbi:cilia- and flagella-associated protein 68 isoform 1-T1 [Molossus nigricans]